MAVRLIAVVDVGQHISSFKFNNIPLSTYRKGSFYKMRNCALDRFGTALEKRYSKADLRAMMTHCGLENISFGKNPDANWCVIAYKKGGSCHS